MGTEEQSDLLVRLSASSSVTWPPKTTFLIASDGCAQGKAIKRGELTGQSGAARLGAEARGGREGALPGRGGAAATALRGRWLGPGAAATRVGRPWRCGSSSPAPPSPSPPRRRPALLPLSLSRRFVCSLSLKREGGGARLVRWSGAGGWSSSRDGRQEGRCGVPVLHFLFPWETQHVATITDFAFTDRWGPVWSHKPDMRGQRRDSFFEPIFFPFDQRDI